MKEFGHLKTEERHLQRYTDMAVKWYEYLTEYFKYFVKTNHNLSHQPSGLWHETGVSLQP